MTAFIKIIAAVIVSILCGAVLRQYKKEYVFVCELAGAAAVISLAFIYAKDIIESLRDWTGLLGEQAEYLPLLLKAVAVAVLTQLVCEACRDSSNGLLASCAELAGRLTILILSLPLIKVVMSIALSMLGE